MTIRPAIILFDGCCNLCNDSVQFIVRHDRRGRFRFAPLQSSAARSALPSSMWGRVAAMDSILLIEADGSVHEASTAALRIARRLDGLWPIWYGLIVVPRPWRDAFYRWVARRRYDWFGRRASCMVPTPALRDRFLE